MRQSRGLTFVLLSLMLGALVLSLIFTQANTTQAAAPAWQPNVAYHAGDQVTYNNNLYQCLQAHTSQVGWEPPNVPALWQALGSVTPTATTTVAPTTTPVATTTVKPTTTTPVATTTTPVATTTTPTTGCTAPTYSSTAIYTNGMQVSYNGHTWQAKWWTQGEAPSTGGSGVWQDLGQCGTVTTTTPVATTTTPVPTTTTRFWRLARLRSVWNCYYHYTCSYHDYTRTHYHHACSNHYYACTYDYHACSNYYTCNGWQLTGPYSNWLLAELRQRR
jgi:chitodextrinase